MNQKQTAATVKESLTTGDRERFEHWASDDGEYPKAIERVGDVYKLAQTQGYWFAWHQCSTKSPAIAVIDSQAAEIEQLREALTNAEDRMRRVSRLLSEGHQFIDRGDTVRIWADDARAALSGEPT